MRKERLEAKARTALAGVGDRRYEWVDWTGYAFHVRRRLTDAEAAGIDAVLDLRGTEEGRRRLRAIEAQLSPEMRRFALQELYPHVTVKE
jgi:hypothetical protein